MGKPLCASGAATQISNAITDISDGAEALLDMDGALVGTSPADYVAQVVGNGNGGSSITTGWQLFQKTLGTLPAGTHTLIVGGYNNKKNSESERTTILIDDVTVTAQ